MDALFAAFDLFPTAKGSTARIAHTLQALQSTVSTMTLACLGYSDMPRMQQEGSIFIRRCLAMHPNFLKRTEFFGNFLYSMLSDIGSRLDVMHFRDIWGGIPILEHPSTRHVKTIFEVNGVLSIELPMHYPSLYRNSVLISHIRTMEARCWQQADQIITVSRVNARYVQDCGVPAEKISVIPNIAAIEPADSPRPQSPLLLYAGTLTPWQGVSTLIQAFHLIAEQHDLRLMLACSTKKFLRPVRKQIKKLGLRDRVDIVIGMPREQLYNSYRQAVFTLVPLTRCDRNELQGCCPLKIVESMAVGTPVIASNLAVCRELIEHGIDGWLVTPDSPRSLAHAMHTLLEQPKRLRDLGLTARRKITHLYTQKRFAKQLQEVYTNV